MNRLLKRKKNTCVYVPKRCPFSFLITSLSLLLSPLASLLWLFLKVYWRTKKIVFSKNNLAANYTAGMRSTQILEDKCLCKLTKISQVNKFNPFLFSLVFLSARLVVILEPCRYNIYLFNGWKFDDVRKRKIKINRCLA